MADAPRDAPPADPAPRSQPELGPQATAFRQAAEAYCTAIETIATTDPHETLTRLRFLLAALISAALVLPTSEPVTATVPPGIGHDAWSARFAAIDSALGSAATYWAASLSSQDVEPEVVLLPLADDLADIWRDLRPTLDQLASGTETADVVWQWRFTFDAHWGLHAVEALRALHIAITAA
ncbi:DUF5063 domain-containing protein [Myceligenerans xiligouense]|nr:DUF5063 domain-containing protein [Myceligenerans xiligouense]